MYGLPRCSSVCNEYWRICLNARYDSLESPIDRRYGISVVRENYQYRYRTWRRKSWKRSEGRTSIRIEDFSLRRKRDMSATAATCPDP